MRRHRHSLPWMLRAWMVGLLLLVPAVAHVSAHAMQINIYPGYGDYYTTHVHNDKYMQECGAAWTNDDDDTIDEYSTSSAEFLYFGIRAYNETGYVIGGVYSILDATDSNNDMSYFNLNDVVLNNNQYYDFSTYWTVGSAPYYYPSSYITLWSGHFGSGDFACGPHDQVAYAPQ